MIRLHPAQLMIVARAAVCILAVLSLTVSVVLPAPVPPDTQTWHNDQRFTEGGHSVALPAVNERTERLGERLSRGISLILPAVVLEQDPAAFGSVILPERSEPALTSYFVYTQTTSSRL